MLMEVQCRALHGAYTTVEPADSCRLFCKAPALQIDLLLGFNVKVSPGTRLSQVIEDESCDRNARRKDKHKAGLFECKSSLATNTLVALEKMRRAAEGCAKGQ